MHDSDGLLIHGGAENWTWRPLVNPDVLRKSSFPRPIRAAAWWCPRPASPCGTSTSRLPARSSSAR
ncbi:glucan biosynthesis protein [Hansschlegelia beijingensis]